MENLSFVWTPGVASSSAALERLRQHFPCPAYPMGEAWFMSKKRVYFDNLLGDLQTLHCDSLAKPLDEIYSGYYCFGPRREWTEWFHYLLAPLIPRAHETIYSWGGNTLLESLVSGFINEYPMGMVAEPYTGFMDDVLATLGQHIMQPRYWPAHGGPVGLLERPIVGGWARVCGNLSASLFFCAKYLPADRVEDWFASVLAIDDTHWMAQLMLWLRSARPVLSGASVQPYVFRQPITWQGSRCLRGLFPADRHNPARNGQFLPTKNGRAVLHAVKKSLTAQRFQHYLNEIAQHEQLAKEVGNLPMRFARSYKIQRR